MSDLKTKKPQYSLLKYFIIMAKMKILFVTQHKPGNQKALGQKIQKTAAIKTFTSALLSQPMIALPIVHDCCCLHRFGEALNSYNSHHPTLLIVI